MMRGKAPTAHVRSTLPEVPAGGVRSGADTGGGGERRPVAGEAHTGDAEVDGRAEDERSEADGTGAAMSPEAASRVCGRRQSADEARRERQRPEARGMPS